MRRLVLVVVLVLAGCGESTPDHLQAAERVCSDAEEALDRAGEKIVEATAAWEQSRSNDDILRAQEGWAETDRVMQRAQAQLRAAHPLGEDRKYDIFVAAWETTAELVTTMTAQRALEDPAQADETFAQIIEASEQLDIAVRDAGVEDCEAPLEESASA